MSDKMTAAETQTPRTDALVATFPDASGINTLAASFNTLLDHARTLERENADLREQLAEARRERDETVSDWKAKDAELSTAQDAISEWAERAESAERRAAENEKDAEAFAKAKEIFKHMALRENWSEDDISIKRTEYSAERRGIFLYSWGRSPWMVAREFLDEIDKAIVDTALASESGGREG